MLWKHRWLDQLPGELVLSTVSREMRRTYSRRRSLFLFFFLFVSEFCCFTPQQANVFKSMKI